MTIEEIADTSTASADTEIVDTYDVSDPTPVMFKMQDLMQAITGQSDLKRSELRDAAGLICSALGVALEEGRTISLPGLGKITPRKRDSKPTGDLLTARIKLVRTGEKLDPGGDADSEENR